MKGISVIKKLRKARPQHSIITIYKSFVRLDLDYCDRIYDQPNNESLNQKIERIQYTHGKLCDKLCFESLKFRRWFRKLCTFYKIKTTGVPECLFDLILETNYLCNTRSSENVTTLYSRTDVYKYSFFPYTTFEWNKQDKNIQQSKTIMSFRNSLLKTGQPTPKPVYIIHNPTGLKLLTRLRLELSHLNEHKFNHNFTDCVNPLLPCSLEVESSSHFFLHCHYHKDIRKTLFHELPLVDENILNQSDHEIVLLVLLESAIKFILKSERFNGSIL